MENSANSKYQNRILTIPNLLSLLRLCLIPVIVWLYCIQEKCLWTAFVLLLSGITDVADGIIARHYNMVSDFGMIIDPIADKLTQIATMFCLITRFYLMWIPLILLLVKEILAAVSGVLTIRRTGNVMGADWHGKVCTVLLYMMMFIHLVWWNISSIVSYALIAICTIVMLISAILYGIRNINAMKSSRE